MTTTEYAESVGKHPNCRQNTIYRGRQSRGMSSPVVATSIGPVNPSVRDEIAEYRDTHGYPNYNTALQAMLEEVNAE